MVDKTTSQLVAKESFRLHLLYMLRKGLDNNKSISKKHLTEIDIEGIEVNYPFLSTCQILKIWKKDIRYIEPIETDHSSRVTQRNNI